jgi:glycosyltransferase involved in cell wall biosynthesis
VRLGPLTLAPPAQASPHPQLEQRPFVLAIGTVEPRKNLPTLVRAFGEVARQQPDVMLVLAGNDGGHGSAVRTAIDALGPGVSQRVLVTGRVDDPARSWLLHHAAVLAYPSLDEGFGFPLLEAMHTRTPVVAANAGAIPEVAGDAAVLVDPLDHGALAAALIDVITTPTLADQLRAAGDRRLGAFSWTTCAEGLVDLYGRAVRGELDDLR